VVLGQAALVALWMGASQGLPVVFLPVTLMYTEERAGGVRPVCAEDDQTGRDLTD
jgi:hypothetical protein